MRPGRSASPVLPTRLGVAPARWTAWPRSCLARVMVGAPLRGFGPGSYWRYRVGDYRILCEVRGDELLVLVIEVGHRRSIYRRG